MSTFQSLIFNEFSTVEICDFHLIHICSISFSNFIKTVTFKSYKPGLSDCKRIIFVDEVVSAVKHSKVRLYLYFIHPAYFEIERAGKVYPPHGGQDSPFFGYR